MKMTLLQFDDFAEDALAVRAAVLAGGFKDEVGPDGLTYTGISRYEVPHWCKALAEHMGHDIAMRMAFFRQNVEGELPHSWIHSDDICAKFAGVLYLNLPHQCQGGTAFWKHEALDVDALPTREALSARGVNPDWYYAMMNREWKDLTFWRQASFVGMKWNRFISYPTSMFHSRYPFEGFGKTPGEARLVWTCFYDIL